ncbi:MAG TPA: Arc family DNA-binding protein [Longimicrobiaceae bacterium]
MAQVLVRELDEATLDRLKERARSNGRSLQSELKLILEQAARASMPEARAAAARVRERLASYGQTDSAELLREDRER